MWSGPTDTGPVAEPSTKILALLSRPVLSGPAIHVPYRSANSNRKVSLSQLTTHKTHTVASQKQLEGTGITRKGHFHPQAAYKLSGTKSDLFGPERVPRPLLRQYSSCSNRQHHSGVLH